MATKKPVNKVKSKWEKVAIKPEQNSGEVKTVPNQSMSVRDILFRNTQGMTYDNYKTPYYEDQATFSSQSLNKIQEMEPTEKLQFLEELNGQIKDFGDKIKADEAAKAEAAAQQAAAVNTQNETEVSE